MSYATRADLIAALSQDSQARLSNDPLRKWGLGRTDGTTRTWTTPFLEATTAKVYLDGVEQTTGWSLSRATGADGEDQIVFATAPTTGKALTVTADKDAINLSVLEEVLDDVSAEMDSYLLAFLPISDATLLASLRSKAVVLARVKLRERRNIEVPEALARSWESAMDWLKGVFSGKYPLPIELPSTSDDDAAFGSEDPVFSNGGLL